MENNVTTKELQNKMLEMLLYFDSFARKHNLKYYLCGGCLIGAVRHHGFVPWDDDIDLFMPRDDYEKLQHIWFKFADTTKYKYCRTDRFHNYHDAGASIRDIDTTCINRHSVNEDICHGIALEIMPIDGCPKSKIKRFWQLFNAFIFSLFNVQRLPDNKGKFIRFITGLVYKIVRTPKQCYKIWSYAEKQMTKYKWSDCEEVTELIGAIHGMLLRHKKEDFEKVVYLDFEKYKLPVMKGYELYLKKIWGDYMKLPPVEQRVAKHDVICMDLNKSYLAYKGLYYCANNKDKELK